MRMHYSPPLALQTNPKQVRAELSPDPPPSTPSFFHYYSARHQSLLLGHLTLYHCSSLPRTITFPPASFRFNTHSTSGIEAV
jgi:hypothetical protein